jgi:O-antigen ligase
VALTILRDHPIFGVGPGNYMEAMKRYDTLWLDELPVHNVMLWIANETGLLGLGCYLMIVISGLKRLWRSFSERRDLAGRIAMACFIALIAHLLDGMTDPLFREPSVFAMFWIIMSLAVAIPNFPREESPNFPDVAEPAPI